MAPPVEPPPQPPPPFQPLRADKGLEIVQVFDASPRAGTEVPNVQLLAPYEGQTVSSSKVKVRVAVSGFPLAAEAPGNHLRVLLDTQPPVDWYAANDKPLELEDLTAGRHTLRVFAVGGSGVSVKLRTAFRAISFFVGHSRDDSLPPDLVGPLLSDSHPSGSYQDMGSHLIPLDFFVTGCRIGEGGFRVKMKLDDRPDTDITRWAPVWLKELSPGLHKVSLRLIDPAGRVVPGPMNSVTRSFTVSR